MTHYVLGFAFNADLSKVILIRKNRPDWQAGLLNGVGGHIQDLEDPDDAMIREFREETGSTIQGWKSVCRMAGADWLCKVYAARVLSDELFYSAKTVTDEEIFHFYSWAKLPPTIPNLKWLLPLCMDKLNHVFNYNTLIYKE